MVWIAVSAVGFATADRRRLASPFFILIQYFYW
jgi:hypothetical protein